MMHDFKHITSKKRSGMSSLFRRENRTSTNAYKRLIEDKPKKKRLRLLLPIIAGLLVAYPVLSLLFTSTNAVSSVKKTVPVAVKPYGGLDHFRSFQLAADALPGARDEGGHLVAPLADGGKVVYAINEEVQQRVKGVLEQFHVPYGVFVAMEPKTGRVLAMVSHSSVLPAWEAKSFYSLYPMASLFKIITATAALEKKQISPDTVVSFRGGLYSENPRYWSFRQGRGSTQMPIATAMGKSVNPVFGCVACDLVGKESILASAERYGFNQILFPGTSIIPSKAAAPQSDAELKLMGAGLGREVKISPIHAAAMMAAIANNGTMLAPTLAEEIRNGAGTTIFAVKPQPLRTVVVPETADQLEKMLLATISKGTSRKAFHDRRGRPKLSEVNIAAKTGSINGKDPEGHYSWFAAYAPVEDPQIALVALVINQDKWKIKASYLGEQALEAFFR